MKPSLSSQPRCLRALRALRAAALVLAYAATAVAGAKTLRMGNQGDVTSMDTHSLQESFQLSFLANVYEPLVTRGRDFGLEPALALRWKQTDPTTWRFELRRGVRFHDGSPFGADDVVFTWQRTRAESSDTKLYAAPIKEVRKIDDYTVDFVTQQPYPILPDLITGWLMMSKHWCEQHGAQQPMDVRKKQDNYATLNANGTGPFMLKSRQPGVRTVLVANPGWWGKPEHNLSEVVFTPVGNDATRVAALVSGELDVMEPVPLQDIERVRQQPQLKVMQAPELRTIYLGLDVFRDELLHSSVKGRNPLKDKRVRQALYQAIDIEAIRTKLMRGAAHPAGMLLAPGVRGYDKELDKRLPYSVDAARKLLAEAGYGDGFEIGMQCPNDRYVNDVEICQAVAAMWGRAGVKVQLTAESKALYFPKALRREVTVYMLGWQPAANDGQNTLWALLDTPQPGGQGQFNLGRYSNPKLDELTQRIGVETDAAKRQQMMREAWTLVNADIPVLPLHDQMLAWGVKRDIDLVQQPDNSMPLRYVQMK